MKPQTITLTLLSEAEAIEASVFMLKRSAWCAITPYPDDQWKIEFKDGEGHGAAILGHLEAVAVKKASPSTPEPIPASVASNFDTMLRAAHNKDLALVSAIHKHDQQPVFLACAISANEGNLMPIPFAEMTNGNPYELYEDPTKVS